MRGSECDLKENMEMPLRFGFSKEPLLLFALWCFVEMYPVHLTAVSNVSCFCWHQKAEAGELNYVAGKYQAHSYRSKYLEETMWV